MKDWKTTTAGIVSAFFGFVLFAPQHFTAIPVLADVAAYFLAGGLAALGVTAAQARKNTPK